MNAPTLAPEGGGLCPAGSLKGRNMTRVFVFAFPRSICTRVVGLTLVNLVAMVPTVAQASLKRIHFGINPYG